MAFFTDMKRSLTEAGKQVAQKTKEVSDTVQLKTQISRETVRNAVQGSRRPPLSAASAVLRSRK